MLFSSLIDQVTKEPCTVNISEDWMQGRASFGGIVAGLVYESMRQQVTDDMPIRSLQVSFIGPVSSDDLRIESEVFRQGKSVAQVMGKGLQHGGTQVAILGSFGKARQSIVNLCEAPTNFDENPLDLTPLPFLPGVTADFTKHFDFRYCTGWPFSGEGGSSLKGFVRFKELQEVGIPQLIGLIDAWPPAVLPMLSEPAPASTLNWNIEFLQPFKGLRPDEFCQYQADILFAQDGYGATRARIWNQAGELIATSSQTIVVFA